MSSSDLIDIFTAIAAAIDESEIEALLVGGLAVNFYGYSRATVDIDFMIAATDTEDVMTLMADLGFTEFSKMDNVVFFGKPESPVRVDFLKVDNGTIAKLVSRAKTVELAGRRVKIPCLQDLIAMKLFAAAHAEARRTDRDLPDVANLAVLNDLDCEHDLKHICDQHGSEEIYADLCQRIEQLKKS